MRTNVWFWVVVTINHLQLIDVKSGKTTLVTLINQT